MHCGTRGVYFHPYCRNANSIGIELCSRKNGEKFYFMPETVRRAQALTCELMAKYGIPLENVVRHYDVTHKNCPAPFVESASAWTAFKQGLQKKEEPDMTEAEVKKIIEMHPQDVQQRFRRSRVGEADCREADAQGLAAWR